MHRSLRPGLSASWIWLIAAVVLDGARRVALHDLHVVDVVLQEQVGVTDLAADLLRLGGVVEEEARDVAGVDHLHHRADAGLELLRGVAQVFDKGDFQLAEIGATRAMPAVQLTWVLPSTLA